MSQGYSKGIPIDTDPTLSGNSDFLTSSQKAIKTYVDTNISNVNAQFTGGLVSGATQFTGGASANTLSITTTPANNNADTQILARNSVTGAIEYVDSSSITSGVTGTFSYGLAYAMSNQNYLM